MSRFTKSGNPVDATSVDLGEDLLNEPTSTDELAPATEHLTSESGRSDSDDQLQSARILLNEGLIEEAKKVLRRILIQDPSFVPAHRKLEEIHELELKQIFSDTSGPRINRKPAQESEPEDVIEQLDRDLGLGLDTAVSELSIFGNDQAMNEFAEGLELEMQDASARDRLDLGIGFLEMGLHHLAARQFGAAVKEDELRVSATALLAWTYIMSNRAFDAATLLDPILADSEVDTAEKKDLMYLMGRAQEALNQRQVARWWYEKTSEIERHYRDIDERLKRLGPR